MANKRMFAKAITSSGRFLKMPPTSRLLYYDLGMAANDAGIVDFKKVIQKTRAAVDDVYILTMKDFIEIIDDKTARIKDWGIHNPRYANERRE